MATSSRKSARSERKVSGRRAFMGAKIRKQFWLDPAALTEAQAILGTETEQATVELALDLVSFKSDLAAGARVLAGMELSRLD